MTEVVEAEVVESTEIVPMESSNLFRTDDPVRVLAKAQETAAALMPVVREKGLTATISGREYLTVEAWLTLGAMLGVSPVNVWTRKMENGWEARVEARTLDGRVIGAAEAECLTAESRWSDADDFAVRSMAQTRATSKALASVLRFVATLGGAAGTPAEEMDGVQRTRNAANHTTPASEEQRDYAADLLKKSDLSDEAKRAIWRWGQYEGKLSKPRASQIIEALKEGRGGALAKDAGFTDLPPPDDEDLQPEAEPDDSVPF